MCQPYIESATALSDKYVTKKNLNGNLAVDSPFQTLAVDFSSNS